MVLYEYQGPAATLPLANGDELELRAGVRIEVEPTPGVRRLVKLGLLRPLQRDGKSAKDRRRRRRHARRSAKGE